MLKTCVAFVSLAILPCMAVPVLAKPGNEKKARLPAELQVRTDEAVAKGKSWLKKELQQVLPKELPARASWQGNGWGERWLAAYALLKTGLPAAEEPLRSAMPDAKRLETAGVYDLGIAAMLLSEADHPSPPSSKARACIRRISAALIAAQTKSGSWNYAAPWEYKKPPPFDGLGDNMSSAQYALLGLQACANAGVDIPDSTWEKALKYLLGLRQKGNYNEPAGWGYTEADHPYWIKKYPKGDLAPPYGSMTAVGIAGVAICRRNLPPKHKLAGETETAVASGASWLARNFSVEKHPAEKGSWVRDDSYYYYWIYALERAGVFAGRDTFGDHAWYPEGCQALLKRQAADGSWTGTRQEPSLHATAFALLFLTRGSEGLLYTVGPAEE